MEIRTFAKAEYKDHPIYVRNWGAHYEYLTIIKNEIYTAHISVRPRLWRVVLYWLGILKSRYTKAESDATYNYMIKLAETTIDHHYFNK